MLMSMKEFIHLCFYKRLMNPERGNMKRAIVGGLESEIPKIKKREFLPEQYRNTDIWNDSFRQPLLCPEGHYSWEPGDEKTPGSFYANFGGLSLAQLKDRVQNGRWISELSSSTITVKNPVAIALMALSKRVALSICNVSNH